MLFHFLVGVLSLGWNEWPKQFDDGRVTRHEPVLSVPCTKDIGIGRPPCNHTSACLDDHRTDCIEDAYVSGVRLTCAWADYGEELHPVLSKLTAISSSSNAPDVVLVSIGAWWAAHRHNETNAFARAVSVQLGQLNAFFAKGAPELVKRVPRRIYAGTPVCGRMGFIENHVLFREVDSSSRVIQHVNDIARARVRMTPGWEYFDRAVVTGVVCNSERDCAGGGHHYNSRFHPAGAALNVLINMLVTRAAGS